MAPNFGPSSGGPARAYGLRYPHADKRRGASRCLRHRGRAYGARCVLTAANTGLSGRAGGRRVGGYVAPRVVGL